MRFNCEFKTEKIPVSYQMLWVSLIKEALKNVDNDYYKYIYIYDDNKLNKKSKDFCFGVYLKDFVKKEDVFEIKDKVILNFTTPDYNFGIKFYNGLLELNEFQYKDFLLKKGKINLLQEKKINQDMIYFKTLSPICIKSRSGHFLNVEDKQYISELNYVVDLNLKNYRGKGLRRELEFNYSSDKFKKVVVKQSIKKFTVDTGKKYFYVNSHQGIFSLRGAAEDLRDIYQLGVGFKRNQGFGMVDVY